MGQTIQIEEDRHWWFAGRTWSLLNMLDRVVGKAGSRESDDAGPRACHVLDIGCGAGNMFHHLRRYGDVVGVDNNPKPLAVARARGYEVKEGTAEALPFEDERFDLLALLDTMEHCPDDMAVLRECYRVCVPGGHLVITVPAFQWLWSHNDELNKHQRRYTRLELKDKLTRVGFRVRRITYNNFFLFPPAAALIVARRGARHEPELGSPHFDDESYQVEMEPAPPVVNALLKSVTWTESQMLRRLNLPVGTALIAIAQKPKL